MTDEAIEHVFSCFYITAIKYLKKKKDKTKQ